MCLISCKLRANLSKCSEPIFFHLQSKKLDVVQLSTEQVRLQNLAEEAYALFGRYQLKGLIQVCLCNVCMTREQQRQLSITPLRQIPVELIEEYSNSAHAIPANPDELKYILPRYLELIAQGTCPHDFSWEVCLSRFGEARHIDASGPGVVRRGLALAGVRAAPAAIFSTEEATFLDRFLFAVLDAIVAGEHPAEAEEALVMMGQAGTDISGAVKRILNHPSDRGPDIVSEMVMESSYQIISERALRNPFWDNARSAMKSFAAELCAAATIERLTQAVLVETNAARAHRMSEAVTVLETAAAQNAGH